MLKTELKLHFTGLLFPALIPDTTELRISVDTHAKYPTVETVLT